mmetsp:Transcript_104743/g.293610  ORF Transcript_104743/g.293610 Transcript_104743/m.293610 type:complete len:220 (+) Transcript_104743:256-915(+)
MCLRAHGDREVVAAIFLHLHVDLEPLIGPVDTGIGAASREGEPGQSSRTRGCRGRQAAHQLLHHGRLKLQMHLRELPPPWRRTRSVLSVAMARKGQHAARRFAGILRPPSGAAAAERGEKDQHRKCSGGHPLRECRATGGERSAGVIGAERADASQAEAPRHRSAAVGQARGRHAGGASRRRHTRKPAAARAWECKPTAQRPYRRLAADPRWQLPCCPR